MLVIGAFPRRRRATNPPFYRSYHLARRVTYFTTVSPLISDENVKICRVPALSRSRCATGESHDSRDFHTRKAHARKRSYGKIARETHRVCRRYHSRCETFSHFVSYRKFVRRSFSLSPSLARINYRRVADQHHMSTLSACWWLSRVILSQHGVPRIAFRNLTRVHDLSPYLPSASD